MDPFLEKALEQFLALMAFFAFPAFQYLLLRWVARNEGQPQLWYLPAYGFRLVIRNLPRRKDLKDIKYRALLRKIVPRSPGATVKTLQDDLLIKHEDLFLFPGTDEVLVCFRLDGSDTKDLSFVFTDKLGREIRRVPLVDFDMLICDYKATLVNFFNFDIALARRAEVNRPSLYSMWQTIRANNSEARFPIDRIRDVG